MWGLTIVMAAILPTGSAQALAKADRAIVRPDPLVAVVPVGGQVVVNLYVENVQNLYGADIRISFDPAILEVVDADPSVAGVQVQPLSRSSFLISWSRKKRAMPWIRPTRIARSAASFGTQSRSSTPACLSVGRDRLQR